MADPKRNFSRQLFRIVFAVAAALLIARGLNRTALTVAFWGEILAATILLLMVWYVPVAATRERPVTFIGPVAFAIMFWMGREVAMTSLFLAAVLWESLTPLRHQNFSQTPFPGATLALSAYGASVLLTFLAPLAILHAFPSVIGGAAATATLAIIARAALSGLAFALFYGVLSLLSHFGALRTRYRSGIRGRRLRDVVFVHVIGMTPVVLLAPLGGALGLTIALPITLLLLGCATIVRLRLDNESLRRQLQTAASMAKASISDASDVDSTRLLTHFLELAQELVASERAIIWSLDGETGELKPSAGLPDLGEYEGQATVFGEGVIGQAAARYAPRLIPDAARDRQRRPGEAGQGAWMLYPLVVHHRLLGVAQWVRPITRPFTSEDVDALGALVPQVAIALESTRIRETMQNLAATDGLTGLWNHRKMQELLREEMRRGLRYHRALSVLMLDVDSFKSFNDTYGHPLGDRLLNSISAVLRASVRSSDHVGRYGGEEFLIILPETSKDAAYGMAERIRINVEAQGGIQTDEGALCRTVSVGVAAFPEDALNGADIVHCADEALYRAKRSGKNKVIWA